MNNAFSPRDVLLSILGQAGCLIILFVLHSYLGINLVLAASAILFVAIGQLWWRKRASLTIEHALCFAYILVWAAAGVALGATSQWVKPIHFSNWWLVGFVLGFLFLTTRAQRAKK